MSLLDQVAQGIERNGLGALGRLRLNWLYIITMAIGLAVGGSFLAEKRQAADRAEARAEQRKGKQSDRTSISVKYPGRSDDWGDSTY